MASNLDYRVTTETGTVLDFSFEPHPNTANLDDVERLLSKIVGVIDEDVRANRPVGNGDVLQAVAMALAVRARMISAEPAVTLRLAGELGDRALAAADEAEETRPAAGHA